MSQPNHFQPWKQNRPLGIPPNLGGNNSYGKLPAVAHQNPPQTLHLLHQQQQQQQQQQHHQQAVLLSQQAAGSSVPVIQSAAASSSTSAISSSTGSVPGGSSGAASSSTQGGMSDFLSQLGVNKLMLSKLSASYGLANLPVGMPLDHPGQQQQQLLLQQSPMDDCASDKEREVRIQQIFENAIGDNSKKQIVEILEKISILRPPERLLLYLRMPGGYPETDPLRQSQNPLGTRSEINHTINWVRSHLEHDPNVSIPKQEVYDDYTTFCERIDIKPLSTADFGKVMKQVFPGIRPRRLGTRGHSRYCYAAMRKATKLAPPKLPDLSSDSGSVKPEPEDQVPTDEESWKVIKLWAEAMLPGAFGSINELASFITKNNLNSPASIASRQLLQKKLLQREIKERKKLTAAALKKRRRKRRKTLSTSMDSEVADPNSTAAPASAAFASREANAQQSLSTKATEDAAAAAAAIGAATAAVLQQVIKHERPDYADEDNNNSTAATTSTSSTVKQHPSTNLNCDTSNEALVAAAVAAADRQMRSPAEELIFCKKVRQAQQLKAAAQSQSAVSQQMIPNPLRTANAAAKRAASIAHLARQKRLRLLQQQQQRSIEAQNNSAPRYDEMGNLILIESQELVTSSSKEDFIIPRERVISICNMDKNALDDYLNCEEENSQDQDQELLQYFPEENRADEGGGNSSGMGPGMGARTSLEAVDFGMLEDSDTNFKLSQLRSMLEQNMNQSGGMDKQPQVGGQLEGFDGSGVGQQLNLQPGSASASLAMLSQRHHGSTVSSLDSNTCNSTDSKKNLNANMKLVLEGCLSNVGNGSANMIVNNGAPLQSPNGRRKNYDFVPISAGPQSPRVPLAKSSHQNSTPNASPFVSPRNTPIHRKSKAPNNGLTLNILQQQNQPSLQLSGYHQRPSFVKNEISASAPPSPSLAQNYRFGMNPNALNCPNLIPSFQPICGPSSQMHPHQNMSGSLESRSSSVPLIPNYDAYNHSNYTSVSQTPVPSECDDFSDPNNILDMLNETSSSANIQQSIKMEESEPMISEMLDQEDMFSKASVSYNSLSRSVPSTPLPHQMSFNHNHQNMGPSFGSSNGASSKSLFELPKSVPSTPISLNNNRESLFQYSPETSRDYLINGNSVDRTNKMAAPFYSNQSGATVVNTPGASGSGGGGGNVSVASGGPTGTANGTAASAVQTSSGSGTEMSSILADGIESLTDALIGNDTLRYL